MKTKFLLLLILSTLVVGCNTVAGVGRDVQTGGQAIQRAAY